LVFKKVLSRYILGISSILCTFLQALLIMPGMDSYQTEFNGPGLNNLSILNVERTRGIAMITVSFAAFALTTTDVSPI
jgi:hypothetical protein